MISVFWIGTFVMLFLAVGLILLAVFYQRNLHLFKMQESDLLLKASLESEKIERRRISSELHDGLQGDLNTIVNFIAICTRVTNEDERIMVLNEARLAAEVAIQTTRNLSQNLMPPLLEEGGFITAITSYLVNISKSTGKSFSIKADFPNLIIPTTIAYELYRIIQEFCTNALKHGEVNQFLCVFYGDKNNVFIELVDDGIPFDFKTCYLQSEGSGLRSVQSRLKFINGYIDQRTVAEGNHFVIRINN